MIIYLDSDFRCHLSNDGTMTENDDDEKTYSGLLEDDE